MRNNFTLSVFMLGHVSLITKVLDFYVEFICPLCPLLSCASAFLGIDMNFFTQNLFHTQSPNCLPYGGQQLKYAYMLFYCLLLHLLFKVINIPRNIPENILWEPEYQLLKVF